MVARELKSLNARGFHFAVAGGLAKLLSRPRARKSTIADLRSIDTDLG